MLNMDKKLLITYSHLPVPSSLEKATDTQLAYSFPDQKVGTALASLQTPLQVIC